MSGKNPLGRGNEPQAYEGINIIVPLTGWQLIKSTGSSARNPTTNDKKYPVGAMWVNTSSNTVFVLTSVSGGSATWTEIDNSGGGLLPVPNGGTGASSFTQNGVLIGNGTSALTATAAGTTGQVLAGNTGSAPTFQAIPALNVVDVTGTSQAMAVNTTYIADNAGLVTFTLPATAVQGTEITISGNGAGGWTIAQNANQVIKMNNLTTTTGVNGSVSSTNRFNSVTMIATVGGASTTWVINDSAGTFTFV